MSRSSGFALLELCVVVALLCIIALLTMQTSSFYQRLVVHSEVDRLYTLCLATGRSAIIHGKPQTVSFQAHKQSYLCEDASANKPYQLAQGVIFGTLPGVQGPPADPKAAIRQPITFEKQRITFRPDGIIQAGTLYITDTNKKWQYALSCSVGSVPYIRRYRYEDSRWKLLR